MFLQNDLIGNMKRGSNSEDVMESFYNYQWPGTLENWKNLIERIIVTADKEVITVSFTQAIDSSGTCFYG